MTTPADIQRQRVRDHYANNKQYYYDRNVRVRQEKSDYIRSEKDKPCLDCGLKFPHYIMEFDHRGEVAKEYNVAGMINQGWSTIKTEIAKCDVVCANCHRARTWQRKQSGVV